MNMTLLDAIRTGISASVWLAWVAVLCACLPTFLVAVFFAPKPRRWHYVMACFLGGIAGEFCAVTSLFLSLWIYCRQLSQPCNTAQGDVALLYLVPIGSIAGCLLAVWWTRVTLRIPEGSVLASLRRYSGPNRLLNWVYAFGISLLFWSTMTWFLASIMARV
jgi:hypothetical protein